MKRALITGGAGFIGSHLVGELLNNGWSVDVVDDLSTGSILNVENYAIFHVNYRFRFGSVCDESLMTEMIDRVDAVFHLAAVVGVALVVKEPVRTIETNIRGTEIVLAQAARKGKPVLLASTSEVYGKSEKRVFTETNDIVLGPTTAPRWGYACSKAVDEFLALAYHRDRGLPVVIARLFNTVGPGQTGQYGMVLPRFVTRARAGEDLLLYGGGAQTRCFTHVGDTVRIMAALMDCPEAVGEVVNIGSENKTTIKALAERVIDIAHSQSRIASVTFESVFGKNFEDIAERAPSLDKLRGLINIGDMRSLDSIIEDVVEYEKGRME